MLCVIKQTPTCNTPSSMDIVPKESSDSFKNCSFFLFIFLVFIVIITLGGVTLISIFIVVNKPQKPKFSVETLRVESFDVIISNSNCSSNNNSTLLVSSVVSLILNAQNPNKLIGIKYSPSRLHLCLEGIPVGVIRVPGFNQPAESNNVNVATRVLIHSLNVSRIVSGDLSKDDDDDYRNNNNIVQMQLSGDLPLRLQLFRIITMIKIKVFLKCDINVDYRELTFMNEVRTVTSISQNYNASTSVDHSNSTFNNCDIAIYI